MNISGGSQSASTNAESQAPRSRIARASCVNARAAAGELPQVDPDAFSLRSVVALLYLIVFGSWLAFTAYAWLLQNAPISKVSTYAYVNPVVAILLGWAILDEVITPITLVGAAIIVVSVALVVRLENARRP